MLIFALKPGRDGSIAIVRNGELVRSLEAEKDSFGRYSWLTPSTFLDAAELIGDVPDVVALSGWEKPGTLRFLTIGAGCQGLDRGSTRSMNFFGKSVRLFTSSHERSHIMMALGMAPRTDACSTSQIRLQWPDLACYAAGWYSLISPPRSCRPRI
jgi:hydroxymethyl cephem carbamoyltransferase